MKIIDIVNYIETSINDKIGFVENKHLNCGVGFPTGISINNCAAHWTPEINDKTIINENDIIKIDFGIHKNGYIIDSAYTHSFNDKYKNLIDASIEANRVAIENSGVDSILGEIGRDIEETIKSFEVTIKNKVYNLKPVADLTGHSIERYKIHSGNSVPNINLPFYNERMKDGEIYAIEPFATTGKGRVFTDTKNCSHYMIDKVNLNDIRLNLDDKNFFKTIYKKYLTLPFCTRWLDNDNIDYTSLNKLADMNIINSYPPLYDIKKSHVSQHEHTVSISENGVEILS
jgi:methionyl aminopeptidase